ncbi:MAG: 23S rRNA (adenine(2503)-C(2))-methyltransferase RlmN [Defluviitaleaceae bacterium]|nr:23S rRNA (adenine(2503)-C(2))-methyltransferase RlmN [Defluviitaleaceae bacterium]
MDIDIWSMTLRELENFVISHNEKKYRAKQIFGWIHSKFARDFSQMTNLSGDFRAFLEKECSVLPVEIEEKYESLGDEVYKYLLRLQKDTIIESVLMKYSFGNSVCVSTQAGCAMGCAFCRSGEGGLLRNLSAYEILAQVYRIQQDLGERISNIVLMGSGEPLHNFDNAVKFVEIISHEDGLNIGKRHITLSTCGIVPEIYRLADLKPGINLALSLHAPNDEIRKRLMPVAKSYSVDEILLACDYYAKTTGRRVTYEYAMIKGINDSKNHAYELGNRLKGRLCHVNIIPVNEIPEKNFIRPERKVVQEFYSTLCKFKIDVTIRRELGSNVAAACGQLKSEFISKK